MPCIVLHNIHSTLVVTNSNSKFCERLLPCSEEIISELLYVNIILVNLF